MSTQESEKRRGRPLKKWFPDDPGINGTPYPGCPTTVTIPDKTVFDNSLEGVPIEVQDAIEESKYSVSDN